MISVTVDDRQVRVPDGASALDAVLVAGIGLPHLCKDPDRPRLGTCRTCLVGIEGMRGTPASCTIPAHEGMVIYTDDPAALHIRSGVLQLTLDMLEETDSGLLSDLGEAVRRHGLTAGRFTPLSQPAHRGHQDQTNKFWVLDHSRCILCERCVDACQQVQHIAAIALLDRNGRTQIGTFSHGDIASSNCTSCGQCWATCPTTAIRLKYPAFEAVRPGWAESNRRKQREEAVHEH